MLSIKLTRPAGALIKYCQRSCIATEYLSEPNIKEAVASDGVGQGSTAEEIELEAIRRFPFLRTVVQKLSLHPVRFTLNDLQNTLEGLAYKGEQINFPTAFDALWSSGLIGMSLYTVDRLTASNLIKRFGEECMIKYNRPNSNETMYCWHFYEYNFYGNGSDQMRTIETIGGQNTKMMYVLHPRMFDYYRPTGTEDTHP